MKLRNLLSILVVCFSFTAMSFGQKMYATALSADNFKTENTEGVYHFLMPEKITAEEVQQSAEYYTLYFLVDFDEKASKVTISLTDVEEKNRQVVSRFFVSLDIRDIKYTDKEFPIFEFYNTFLKDGNTTK